MIYHEKEREVVQMGIQNLCRRENFVSNEQLCGAGRLLGTLTIPTGGGIADHAHHDEFEVFYVLSGIGAYNNNGVLTEVKAGDVCYCPDGETHGIRNERSEDLVLMAFIGFPAKK